MHWELGRRVALPAALLTLFAVTAPVSAWSGPARPAKGTRNTMQAPPAPGRLRSALERFPGATARFGGFVGERLKAAIEGWLLPAPRANPSLLHMFRDRDRQPRRALVPWAGEFAGKHLTASVLRGTGGACPAGGAESLARSRGRRSAASGGGRRSAASGERGRLPPTASCGSISRKEGTR